MYAYGSFEEGGMINDHDHICKVLGRHKRKLEKGMVVYIYYITAVGKSISSQDWAAPVRANGLVRKKAGGTDHPSRKNNKWIFIAVST
jgi:hypothetical protein